MTHAEAAARAAFLSSELHRHNRLYYIEARPVISDKEFDLLLRELTSKHNSPIYSRRIHQRSEWVEQHSMALPRFATQCR